MKFNKKLQYAVLFTLYIQRGGRVTTKSACETLGIPKNFMEQIARSLRINGIINSIRGPGGGYELNPRTTVKDIIDAVSPIKIINSDTFMHRYGQPEQRALANFLSEFDIKVSLALEKTISSVMANLVQEELNKLNSLDTKTPGN